LASAAFLTIGLMSCDRFWWEWSVDLRDNWGEDGGGGGGGGTLGGTWDFNSVGSWVLLIAAIFFLLMLIDMAIATKARSPLLVKILLR
jgi:hypothetical protein